jgi:hypothetical protein
VRRGEAVFIQAPMAYRCDYRGSQGRDGRAEVGRG